ncbi:secreted protein [Beggiatoa sp. PS]|nr:secreted protein [Beggiatoa sp. PS]
MFKTLTKYICLTLFLLIPTVYAVEDSTAPLIEWWQNSEPVEAQCPGYYYSEATEFYCSAQMYLDYEKLQTISALPIFVQGPHTEKALELNNPYSFGYYNKDFVIWLRESLLPLTTTPAFKELFKFFYNRSVKPVAQTYYIVHERLFANPLYVVREQQTYLRF